jgi:PAP2 superfamily
VPITPLLDRSSQDGSTIRSAPPRFRPRPVRELGLVAALFLVYKVGRAVADGHVARAYTDAVHVWHWERALHLPDEGHIQHALMASQSLVRAANIYYAWAHFAAMIVFLLWAYLFRPAQYVPLRRLVAAVTGVALVVHLTFPLAPPRLVPGLHMIDTATVFGPSVYGPPSDDTLTNQYAAMPSLHVGWALIVAIGLIGTTRSRWRWCWLLYPLCTFTVVVGTANHYWLDGLVGAAIVGITMQLPVIRGGRTTTAAGARIAWPRRRRMEPVPSNVPRPRRPLDAGAGAGVPVEPTRRTCPHAAIWQRPRAAERGTAAPARDHERDAVRADGSAPAIRPTCRTVRGPTGLHDLRRQELRQQDPGPQSAPNPSDRRKAADDRTGG